ncbi:hypothetical protein QSV08_13905 [Maribacter sp. BPC-D8]|uniref:hypothetical protein n=1 Tax=Maribacter sp. BPC-D8 TaxID=3053613 RepID=UPI002B46E8E4|nr:hypothetical protein [Maribacter sp. BPC-D8]WRI28314.1 hypothetical protein QSV08_13905 [Maribacter sp. BPC-D8]
MPFKIAIKLPVFIYGRVDTYILKGNVEFKNCEIKRGMVKMGMNKEYLSTVKGASLIILELNSRLIFKGNSEFSCDFLVRTGLGAELIIGKETFFGASVKLVSIKKILIGDYSRIGFESQVIDSNFHYTYNIEKKNLNIRDEDIIIGNYNWIGNRTTISKGTITKPFTIIANSSITNKNYSAINEDYMILAGQPAKILAKNIRRIYDLNLEDKIYNTFLNGDLSLSIDVLNDIESSLTKLNN